MSHQLQLHLLLILMSCACVLVTPLQRRQVVQPLWLMPPNLLPLPLATKVRVTPQKLQETAAIRASIQKAVNENTYAVAASPQQFLTTLGQISNPFGAIGNPLPMPFALPNATWWKPPLFFAP